MSWREWRDARFSPGDMDARFLALREPVPTGVAALDAALGGGWHPGVNVLMAAPGAGKSALALYSAYAIARRGGACAFYTLEMDAFDCWSRVLSARSCDAPPAFPWSQVPSMARRFLAGEGGGEYVAASRAAARELQGLAIVEPAGRDAHALAADMALAAEAGAQAVFVDYLQYLTVEGAKPGYEAVTAASHAMQAAARALNVPVVLVSSMGRDSARSGEPDMHGASGSGAVEYDATTVTALWRGEDGLMAAVRKNRRGPVSQEPFRLDFYPAYNAFRG